jgi:hypothetical protein
MRWRHTGWLALLGLVALGCAAGGKEQAAMTMTLECAMRVPPRVRAGEPVVLHFRLRNPTARPLHVLTWHTPLEGLFAPVVQVTRDGVDIPYVGPKMKRGDPGAEDYVALAPGASTEAEVELSLAYDMTRPGHYRLAFRGQVLDATVDGAEVPRPLARHQPVPAPCPAVETTVVAP